MTISKAMSSSARSYFELRILLALKGYVVFGPLVALGLMQVGVEGDKTLEIVAAGYLVCLWAFLFVRTTYLKEGRTAEAKSSGVYAIVASVCLLVMLVLLPLLSR